MVFCADDRQNQVWITDIEDLIRKMAGKITETKEKQTNNKTDKKVNKGNSGKKDKEDKKGKASKAVRDIKATKEVKRAKEAESKQNKTSPFFHIVREEIEFGGETLSFEAGHIARQADGAVVVRYGDTVVLCTVVAEKEAKQEIDFFPLTVNYQEKAFAAGKIPGGFFKREGKPSEGETLTSRLIDRPIRPLFPDNFFNEVQIICTVLSHDRKNNPDIVALIGASAALSISGIPFLGPICGVRVGYIDGEFVLNPSLAQMDETDLDLVVAGTKDGVLMVESEANELSEAIMLDAVKFGFKHFAPVLKAIESLKKKAGKPDWTFNPEESEKEFKRVKALVQKRFEKVLKQAFQIKEKLPRHAEINAQKKEIEQDLVSKDETLSPILIHRAFDELEYEALRRMTLKDKKRIDGRKLDEIRPICCEVGVLPRVHGSALFTRGETQALVVATLGSGEDEQIVDELVGEHQERYLLHYNFPPYSVGEIGRLSSPGRREIGHGRLAWRATHPLIPDKENFPYTIRLVSEITESNGSSSMATVCGSSLALMDAGVPIDTTISGIAMGLIKEGKDFVVLSDIQGDEDHLGDMDFKVAGTKYGITALQMDIKITSITFEIMEQALQQALKGRQHIAGKMDEALSCSRKGVSSFAPQIQQFTIEQSKIKDLIGPGGKVIREICDSTDVKIDISDEGEVSVFSPSKEALTQAMNLIDGIIAEPEIGKIYTGTVVKLTDFGAFVNYCGKCDGLVHISEISKERVRNIHDVLHVGDKVKVVLLDIDAKTKKARLSMKAVNSSDQGQHKKGR